MSRGSMHKRAVECRFLEFCVDMAKWPLILKVKINDPHFQYQPRESLDAYLVQSGSFYFFTSYYVDKPRFLEFWVKVAKMTLKIKVNDLHFQYQPRVSQDACLVQVLEFKCEYLCRWRCGVISLVGLKMFYSAIFETNWDTQQAGSVDVNSISDKNGVNVFWDLTPWI